MDATSMSLRSGPGRWAGVGCKPLGSVSQHRRQARKKNHSPLWQGKGSTAGPPHRSAALAESHGRRDSGIGTGSGSGTGTGTGTGV
jgi:hypothetical protein